MKQFIRYFFLHKNRPSRFLPCPAGQTKIWLRASILERWRELASARFFFRKIGLVTASPFFSPHARKTCSGVQLPHARQAVASHISHAIKTAGIKPAIFIGGESMSILELDYAGNRRVLEDN
jgi:hypothetical protein